MQAGLLVRDCIALLSVVSFLFLWLESAGSFRCLAAVSHCSSCNVLISIWKLVSLFLETIEYYQHNCVRVLVWSACGVLNSYGYTSGK